MCPLAVGQEEIYQKLVANLVDLVWKTEVLQRVQVVQAVSGTTAQLTELLLVAVDLAHGPPLAVDVGEQGAAGFVPTVKDH